MKNAVLRLTAIALLAVSLVLEQSGAGRAQEGPESRDLGDTSPVWSPTGELIAFVSTRDLKPEIYVMKADGTAQRRLTTSPPGIGSSMPAWSPDGRFIAFVTGALGASQISIMNADGSTPRGLVSDRGNTKPAWSPDGRKIAFISNRTGKDELYVIPAEGGQLVRIPSETPGVFGFTWSPDGRRLAFAASNFEIMTDPTVKIRAESRLSVADADGRNRSTLATAVGDTDPKKIIAALVSVSDPTWSPDGRRIAFDSFQGELTQIHVINPDGSGRVPLTSQGANYGAAWAPGGDRIAFLSHRGGQWQVFVMNADGSGQLRLTGSGEDRHPTWSPDGRRIVYASKRGELWQLYSVNTDGTGETRLTEGQ
jgi:Tol biopolymer transport system component